MCRTGARIALLDLGSPTLPVRAIGTHIIGSPARVPLRAVKFSPYVCLIVESGCASPRPPGCLAAKNAEGRDAPGAGGAQEFRPDVGAEKV